MTHVAKITKEIKFGEHTLILETGEIARQADGAVFATMDGTQVLVTVVGNKEGGERNSFFPLTIDYQEKTYAAGKIPGGFRKREGQPAEDETLTSRLIDRPLRPLFPDEFRNEVQIIATGSSSFDLANKIIEPLTGRAFEYTLPPLSVEEVQPYMSLTEKKVHELFQYGMYPAVVGAQTIEDKKNELKRIATNYLYKDIFVFENIKYPKILEDLLRSLASRVGGLIATSDLAKEVGANPATAERYIRLLEQSFIIKRIYAFSNNHSNELKKAYKVIFIDTGIRNVLTESWGDINSIGDKGTIFENFFMSELWKIGQLKIFSPRIMFWRTRQGDEIDCIEQFGQDINAYECKWKDQQVSFSLFLKKYPMAKTQVVTPTYFITQD